MPSKFDELPLDVIHYEILPFLSDDYFARIGINSMLLPIERTSTPLRKNAAIELEMSLTLHKFSIVLAADSSTPSTRGEQLMAAFNLTINNPLFLKYNRKFRDIITEKGETYADPNFQDYGLVSEDEKAQLVVKSNKILEVLEKNLYVCDVSPSFINDEWSPIK